MSERKGEAFGYQKTAHVCPPHYSQRLGWRPYYASHRLEDLPLLCSELHQDTGCDQDIPATADWQFCPRCGRNTGHAMLPGLAFRVRAGASAQSVFFIKNDGPAQVTATLKIVGGVQGLVFGNGQTSQTVAVPGDSAGVAVRLSIPALRENARHVGRIEMLSDDGPRPPGSDPWTRPPLRKTTENMTVEVDIPARILPNQEALFFRDDRRDRKLVVTNLGTLPGTVTAINVPDDFEVVPREATLTGQGGTAEFTLKWTSPKSGLPQTDEAIVELDDGQALRIGINRKFNRPIRLVPHAIVAVDMGTAFTTVAIRIPSATQSVEDEVYFLKLPDEESPTRFHTRVWIDGQWNFHFAGKATSGHRNAPGEGYFIREIKTLLRDSSPEVISSLISPQRPQGYNLRALESYYGPNWPSKVVTRYLKWLRTDLIDPEIKARFPGVLNPAITYVFSLPVLDFASKENHPAYALQRQRMEDCVRDAEFPQDSVEYHMEPVCAALGLVHPPSSAEWTGLATQKHNLSTGNRIVFFDSGGGTTDVALLRATNDGGNIELEVERCLGVGHEFETFGGEAITTAIEECVKNPGTAPWTDKGEWFTGQLNLDAVFPNRETQTDVDNRDDAEKVKKALATGNPYMLQHSTTGAETGGSLNPVLLYYLVREKMASLIDMLRKHVFDTTKETDVNYYCCVGGNTSIPDVRNTFARFLGDESERSNRRLQWPEEYRQTAIAYGGVWVPDSRIRNAVPYGVTVELEGDGVKKTLLTVQANTSEEAMSQPQPIQMPQGAEIKISVKAHSDGESYIVDSATFCSSQPETTTFELRSELQNGHVRVECKVNNEKMADAPLIRYPL